MEKGVQICTPDVQPKSEALTEKRGTVDAWVVGIWIYLSLVTNGTNPSKKKSKFVHRMPKRERKGKGVSGVGPGVVRVVGSLGIEWSFTGLMF